MQEILLNLHMHTPYSDGSGSHMDIARAALRAGLDAVIVTDHNVHVQGMEKVVQEGRRRVLLLVGEEVHDQARQPAKNHLLVYGSNRELATFAANPQRLLDQVRTHGGVSFIAHPYDPELKFFHEPDISWENWEVYGFTGIELWNAFSEMKIRVHNRLQGIFYAFFPQFMAVGPHPAALRKWDELLTQRHEKCVAVGGSDAHALHLSLGPLQKIVFPYEFHFQAVNTHLLLENNLTGDLTTDRQMVLAALKAGHAFIGYDLPAPTRGFRFTAQGRDTSANMGDEIRLQSGVTIQIRLPQQAECRLICDGQPLKTWTNRDVCTHTATQPGVYRAEVFITYLGRKRSWIYSNPIYVRS